MPAPRNDNIIVSECDVMSSTQWHSSGGRADAWRTLKGLIIYLLFDYLIVEN